MTRIKFIITKIDSELVLCTSYISSRKLQLYLWAFLPYTCCTCTGTELYIAVEESSKMATHVTVCRYLTLSESVWSNSFLSRCSEISSYCARAMYSLLSDSLLSHCSRSLAVMLVQCAPCCLTAFHHVFWCLLVPQSFCLLATDVQRTRPVVVFCNILMEEIPTST